MEPYTDTQQPSPSSDGQSFVPSDSSRFGRIMDRLENHRVIVLSVIGFIILVEIVWAVSSFVGSSSGHTTARRMSPRAPQSTAIAGVAENHPFPAGVSFTIKTPQTVAIGKTVSAVVTLNTAGQNTDGATAVITYNPTTLTFQKVTNGTLYSSYLPPVVDQKAGTIRITGITDINAFYKGTGVFATVLFTPKAAGATQLGFAFTKGSSKASAVASDKEDILTAAVGTAVQIQ